MFLLIFILSCYCGRINCARIEYDDNGAEALDRRESNRKQKILIRSKLDALPFTKEAYAHIETAALSYNILFYKLTLG